MTVSIQYHPGRGYKVNQMLNAVDERLVVYNTKKAASDVAKMGGWKRTDVVKVWGPLFGGYMPAYASTNGDGKHTLIFLSADFLCCEVVVEEMPVKRQAEAQS